MAEHIAGKVREWLLSNVHNYPLEDKADEVRRLTRALTDDMMKEGFDLESIEDQIGSLEDRVEDYFEQVQDSELGFKG